MYDVTSNSPRRTELNNHLNLGTKPVDVTPTGNSRQTRNIRFDCAKNRDEGTLLTNGYNNDCVSHPELNRVTTQKGMKFLSWNIRSLPKHYDELCMLFTTNEIDVINICESWLGPDNPNNQYRLPNYKIYRNDRSGRKKGGGLCTYVRGGLSCNALTSQEFNVSNENIETVVLELNLPQTRPIILINLYRPPQR